MVGSTRTLLDVARSMALFVGIELAVPLVLVMLLLGLGETVGGLLSLLVHLGAGLLVVGVAVGLLLVGLSVLDTYGEDLLGIAILAGGAGVVGWLVGIGATQLLGSVVATVGGAIREFLTLVVGLLLLLGALAILIAVVLAAYGVTGGPVFLLIERAETLYADRLATDVATPVAWLVPPVVAVVALSLYGWLIGGAGTLALAVLGCLAVSVPLRSRLYISQRSAGPTARRRAVVAGVPSVILATGLLAWVLIRLDVAVLTAVEPVVATVAASTARIAPYADGAMSPGLTLVTLALAGTAVTVATDEAYERVTPTPQAAPGTATQNTTGQQAAAPADSTDRSRGWGGQTGDTDGAWVENDGDTELAE